MFQRVGMAIGWLLLGVLPFIAAGSPLCLADGIPEEERAFLKDSQGNDMPVGILELNWPSAGLLAELAKLLIKEVLGFHAEIGEPLGASGAAPIYALAGCRNFNAANDKQCGETEPVMHVSLDSWIGSYSSAYEQMKADYPDIAPLDLGDMGYSGEESVYVHTNLLQEAYENEGLALEFYKSYNVSHHHAKQYFSSTSDIPFGALSRCNATDFSNAQRMSDFVKYSFDYDGVDQQGNGDYVARCPDGHWWPAPACRQNPSECIPLITAGTGWKLQAIMQWAVAYGLPAAVGITASWGDYVALPRAHRVLHYWWVPDSTFIDLGPQPIGMPRHSALEWSMGDKKTSAVGSYVAKMVSQDLSSKARTIQEFVSQITFELKEIMDLLLEVQTEGSRYNVSCAWARQNVARWTAWVPVSTNCYEGFGLADDQGVHVQTRAAASACAVCPEGTFSEEFADNTGKTYRCSACPSGTYQDKVFSSSCKPCSRGTYSDTVGSKECKPCDVAFYQGLEQQMSCMACPADRTTRLLAATREEDCVCKAKFIEREGQCVSCDEETLWCPVGSTISKLQGANGTDDVPNPHILEGYFSYPEEPLATYKCRDAMCPGGAPGSCLGGKEGLTCRRCPEGQFASSGPCHDCGDYVGALWVVGLVAMAGGVTGAYYVSSSRYIPKASPIFRALVSGDIAVMVLQNVAVVQVVWGSGTGLEFFTFTSFLVLDLDGAGISCLWPSAAGQYAGVVTLWPIILFLILIVYLCSKLCRRRFVWTPARTIGLAGKFLQVGFTSMTNLGLMPFVCFRHPNGAYSMLKYSDIICGSGEHVLMQVFGGCLLALGLIFLSVCTLWTMMAPKWSSNAEKLGQVNFLIRRFQPNTWWFGLFLLTRGPFLSLPTILAPDSSSLQLSMMLMVLMVSLGVQATVQPWQTPWLNLADTISVSALACVLAVSLGCADGECEPAMETLWVVLAVSLLLILGFFVLMAWLGALYSQVAGKDLAFLNLYKTSHPETIVEGLRDLTRKVSQEDQEQLTHAVANLCFYDLQSAHLAIQALQDCWGIEPRFSGRSRISTTVSQEMELEGEAEDTDAKVLKQGPDLGGAMSSSAEEVHESMTSFMVPTLSDQRPNEAGLVQCEL
ncbi:unnamed protein product [Durusdinium trenchii]|uniref:Tyrosine-protein kinase ephrin type A/B receptor-like domain-containing protein n=1 Tax=Durusdinium trenchii TaxID=1381693 RepID=A0ABP0PA34_9DINO